MGKPMQVGSRKNQSTVGFFKGREIMSNRIPREEVRAKALNYYDLLCKLAEERDDPYPILRAGGRRDIVVFTIQGQGSLKGVFQCFDNLCKEDIAKKAEPINSNGKRKSAKPPRRNPSKG
jgi:hypothetical protein